MRSKRCAIMCACVAAAGAPSTAGIVVVQDFDSLADSAALTTLVTAATANTTVTLDTTGGLGGTQAIVFTGSNGSDPYYSQFTMDIADLSLDGVDAIDLSVQFRGGSNENFTVQLLDSLGGTIAQAALGGTQSLPSDAYAQFSVATDFTSDTVASIRFTYNSSDYGTTSVAVDNIVAVPAPSALALASLGAFACVRRRRHAW